jgi:IclR family transcriptional regulator, acetate operon repressor
MSSDPSGTGAEGTALRALRVLEVVSRSGGPHRLGDIARATGIAKPSTHRILGSLASAGYVVSNGAGTYGPGPRTYALSALFVTGQQGDNDAVLRQFQSEVDQTVHVALRSGDHAIYVQKVESDRPYRMASRLGGHIQLHCTAIGKAILAHVPPDDRAHVLAGSGLPPRTANTITDVAALEHELDRVRERGYAVDDEENEETIRCIAAPLLDRTGHAVGGVSISTITFQLPMRQLLDYAPRLIETAKLLATSYT